MAKSDKSFSFDEIKDELTDQQRLFCMEYVTTFFNGTRAAINAGYAKESATEQASRLLTKDKVKDLLAIYKSDVGAMLGLSAYHVAKRLWEWVDSDITETLLLSPEELKEMPRPLRGLITQYKTTTVTNDYGQTTTIELKFVSKERAMEMLKQMLGYDKPAKIANTDSEGKDVAQLNIIAPVGLKLEFPNNTDGATT
jgi:phage terminase small subunit